METAMPSPIPPSGNYAYYSSYSPVGQARGSRAAFQPQQATGQQSLESLKQQLGGGVLNASRTIIGRDGLDGLQDGQPVTPMAHHVVPNTGLPKVDQAIDKTMTTAGEVAGFVPQAVGTTASETFRDSMLGGIAAFLTSTVGSGIAAAVKKEFTTTNAAATILIMTLAGSFIGGGVGFLQSIVENLRDLKSMLLGPRL